MTRLFRKQLIVAILPVLLLAGLSTIWTTRVSERQMIAQFETELYVESELHAAGIRALLDERLAELRTIAASPIMRGDNSEEKVAYLAADLIRMHEDFEGLYLNGIDGNVLGTRGERFDVSKRAYFPRYLKGETIITDEITSLATGQPIVLLLVPILDENGVQRGGIGGTILVSKIQSRVQAVVQPERGFATLVDSRGEVLTPKAHETDTVRSAFVMWLKENHRPTSNDQPGPAPWAAQNVRLQDESFLIVHQRVPQTGWQLFLAKRAAIATQPATQIRWANLLVSALVLVVAFLVVYYFTGKLLGPLAELLEVHRRFGQGDYQARITDLPDDELGELGHAFNRTAAQLAERQAAQKAAERSLRESEARLRMISENVDDAVFLHDPDGKIRDVNHATCASLGYTNDELLALNSVDILAKPDEAEIRNVWRSIVQRQEKVRLEGSFRRKDGTTFPVEMSDVPLQTAQGVRILISARDVTERRRAEDQMANFFRLSEDMMCIADSDGIFRRLSPAFEQVLGYQLNELLGQPYLAFVHPDDVERTREEGRKIYEGRGDINFENRYRCKDGSYKWLQWRPFREIYEGMIYAIARDVTDSHRTARLMQQTSKAAKIGGWEFEYGTNKIYWSEETYRLHDLSPETYEPVGETAMAYYTDESRATFFAAAEKASAEGAPYDLELQMVTAAGRKIWVHVLGRTDFEHGKPIRSYGSFQDITDRKAAEDERRQIDAQLREMQRVESIGILAGGIAHDFNNLLTGVLGFTRLAAAEAEATGSEAMRSHLQQIEQCSLRAADLCKQLLAYAGKGQFMVETIDLSDLVRETATLVESIIGSHAKLEVDLDDRLPLIEGDPTQLRQVVMNLVTNAFDALGQAPGKVCVTTGQRDFSAAELQAAGVRSDATPGRLVYVEVRDTGVGMSEATAARIFDPFFTTKFAGRGLGLAAVQGIIRSHRGAILVDSKLGEGTTFTVVLPPAEDPEAERVEQRVSAAIQDSHPRPTSGGTILLMDDEKSVLALARTALERGGYKVLSALDGLSGLELFKQHREEVVAAIVDITMPGMNGVDVLRKLRELAPELPLLPMSGYTEKSLDAASAELKLSAFVEKPFRLGDVVAAVQSALQPKP